MTEARALRDLMGLLSVELADWSRASQHLETVFGGLADRCAATPAEIQELQILDRISQHLSQLSRLCHDLGGEAGQEVTVSDAISRLDLSDLRARLSRAEVAPAPAGDTELW